MTIQEIAVTLPVLRGTHQLYRQPNEPVIYDDTYARPGR